MRTSLFMPRSELKREQVHILVEEDGRKGSSELGSWFKEEF
jgi:hypothetical protein